MTNYLTERNAKPKLKLSVARVKYAGDYDPEPGALPQLRAFMGNFHDVDLQISAVSPEELSASTQVAFLTVSSAAKFTQEQAAALRKWTDAGGTLWIDAAAGSACGNGKARRANGADGPDRQRTAGAEGSSDHDRRSALSGLRSRRWSVRTFRHDERTPRATVRGKITEGKPAVLVVRGDLTSGIAGMNHWGIAGFAPTAARRLAANSLLQFVPPPLPPPAPATKPTTKPTTKPATKPARIPKPPTTGPVASESELMFPATTRPMTQPIAEIGPATKPVEAPTTAPALPGT